MVSVGGLRVTDAGLLSIVTRCHQLTSLDISRLDTVHHDLHLPRVTLCDLDSSSP